MIKTAFMIEPREYDTPVIMALDKLGYSVLGAVTEDAFGLEPLFSHKKMRAVFYEPVIKGELLSDFQFRRKEYLKIIKKNKVSVIFPSASTNNALLPITGYLNQVCGLPGLNSEQAKFWRSKVKYFEYFKRLGVKSPRIFQLAHPRIKPCFNSVKRFPVICKPDAGHGGHGVFVASGPQELERLFQPAPKGEKISELEKWRRPKLSGGKMANYLYDNDYSKYIIQRFAPGPLLELTGIKARNGVEISLVFEIEPSDLPFRSENGFLAPFPPGEESAVKKAVGLAERMAKEPVFPYGPFMIDFILSSDKDLYLIDAAPRFSSPSAAFFEPCYGDASFAERSVQALLGQKIEIQKRAEPKAWLYSKNLPLPKGQLISFCQKEPFSDCVVKWEFALKPGDKIYRERNDFLSQRRGTLTVVGKSAKEAKNNWLREFKKLEFLVKEDKSPII